MIRMLTEAALAAALGCWACAPAVVPTPRSPSPGVPPYVWIPQWSMPAVLCVHGTELVHDGERWGCR